MLSRELSKTHDDDILRRAVCDLQQTVINIHPSRSPLPPTPERQKALPAASRLEHERQISAEAKKFQLTPNESMKLGCICAALNLELISTSEDAKMDVD